MSLLEIFQNLDDKTFEIEIPVPLTDYMLITISIVALVVVAKEAGHIKHLVILKSLNYVKKRVSLIEHQLLVVTFVLVQTNGQFLISKKWEVWMKLKGLWLVMVLFQLLQWIGCMR